MNVHALVHWRAKGENPGYSRRSRNQPGLSCTRKSGGTARLGLMAGSGNLVKKRASARNLCLTSFVSGNELRICAEEDTSDAPYAHPYA